MPLSIGHYLNNMSKLTNQWTTQNYREPDRQRIYLKDIDCPQLWHDKLEEQTPAGIFYLNDSTGDVGGPGSRTANSKGIARCGDLMSCLPLEMRAENMMCYIGHEGTYTPAHREMCASLGHNLMVESSGQKDEEGKTTKPGSSIWFMTETKDRHLVSEYWLSTLGHDIEVEKHFAQIAALKNAPFTTYIVEQKAGDFILIPPLAPHQVWNRGTRTMKVAWNRTTVETLEMALHEALPRARMVCRDEQYKNKAMIYFTLQKYSGLIKDAEHQKQMERNPLVVESLKYSTRIKQLQKDFKRLFALYTEILFSEMLAPVSASEKRGQYLPFESFVTCSYCRCNIFNRFLTCTTCTEPLPNGEDDTYDICMDCFAMGRSCTCISAYKWVEQFPWQELVQKHEEWRQQILNFEGTVNSKSPKPLQAEKKALQKKTLAQVCQEQLKIRPWSDPKNPIPTLTHAQKKDIGRLPDSNGDNEVDEVGNPKKKAKRRNLTDKNFDVEHVSLYPEEKWKLATCSKCDRSYSYGSLWRMFDLMPLTVMENSQWKCPYCLRICSCGACRKKDSMKPYEPQGTVLGHDTKAVADRRSMEHLVDFSHSNMRWITAVGDNQPHESRRLNRRIEEAEIAKSQDPTLDENYIDQPDDDDDLFVGDGPIDKGMPIDPTIDPALLTVGPSQVNGHVPPNRQSPVVGLGISSRDSPPPESSVNGSKMLPKGSTPVPGPGQDHASFVSNGITYEYPDPTESQSMPFAQPTQASDQPAKQSKSKRKAELNLVQTDAAPEAPEPTNQLSQYQVQQSLQQAKEKDRSIIAEAALTGKSLVLSLPISGTRLATINKSQSSKPASAKTNTSAKDLLQSDLTAEELNGSKRKKTKEAEDDAEFKIRQRVRVDDLPSTTTAANKNRNNRTSYAEATSSSEDEDIIIGDNMIDEANKHQNPRPLPGYLARRNEDLDLPDELPIEEPRRKSLPTTPKTTRLTNITKPSNENTPPSSKRGRGRPARNLSPAEKLAVANQKAKMKAVTWADRHDQEDSGSESEKSRLSSEEESSDELAVHSRSTKKKKVNPNGSSDGGKKLMAAPMSMLDRKRMMGKKVRVASAKSVAVGRK